ncbi:MAG: hypothetical protein HOU01_10245, partial [Streptomycetaceae bacterium]|nr:hypothetical protein [Streptomycetaceae bacterium]
MNDDRHAASRHAEGPADIHADETGAGVPHVPSKTVLRAGLLAARADRGGEERHAAARA